MHSKWVLRVAAFAFVLTAGCRSMGCGNAKQASSPEKAVQMMETASREGNFDQMTALMPKRQREMMGKMKDTLKRVKDLQHEFNEAMDDKFGKAPDSSKVEAPDINELQKKDDRFRAEIVSQEKKDENNVKLKMKITATTDQKTGATKSMEAEWTAVKEDDGWKLRMGADDMSDEGEKLLNSMFDQQIKGLEQTTADIKAGKIQGRLEAMKALASHSPFRR